MYLKKRDCYSLVYDIAHTQRPSSASRQGKIDWAAGPAAGAQGQTTKVEPFSLDSIYFEQWV